MGRPARKAVDQLRAGDYKSAVAAVGAIDNDKVNSGFDDLGMRTCGSDA